MQRYERIGSASIVANFQAFEPFKVVPISEQDVDIAPG
jgi:hypothetical protein